MTRAERRARLSAGIARLEGGNAAERWCAEVLRAWLRSIPPVECEGRAGRLLDRADAPAGRDVDEQSERGIVADG